MREGDPGTFQLRTNFIEVGEKNWRQIPESRKGERAVGMELPLAEWAMWRDGDVLTGEGLSQRTTPLLRSGCSSKETALCRYKCAPYLLGCICLHWKGSPWTPVQRYCIIFAKAVVQGHTNNFASPRALATPLIAEAFLFRSKEPNWERAERSLPFLLNCITWVWLVSRTFLGLPSQLRTAFGFQVLFFLKDENQTPKPFPPRVWVDSGCISSVSIFLPVDLDCGQLLGQIAKAQLEDLSWRYREAVGGGRNGNS